ncbi:polysaccharide deacetylase family protein [Candidatus Woesearchaeota archaeon]|nr:polysaccharide deacetylase family protein [Candidatus Woesearchaeota archaeon]
MRAKTKYLILTFDCEEFVGRELGADIPEDAAFEIGRKGLQIGLGLLQRLGIKATLFSTWTFAQYAEKEIKQAISEGHEIALHGYEHHHRYAKMPEGDAEALLREAKERMEKKFSVKIVSFRGPQMSRPPYAVLERIGIKVDSSCHPTYIPGHYNNFFKTRKVHNEGGITVVPISVTPVLRMPFSWIWLRNLPLAYSKLCTKLALIDSTYLNLYFHPWEFVPLEGFKGEIPSLIVRKTGNLFLQKLEMYLRWCLSSGLQPVTMKEFVGREGSYHEA